MIDPIPSSTPPPYVTESTGRDNSAGVSRIVVLGATSLVGSEIVRALLELEVQVVGVSRQPNQASLKFPDAVSWRYGDLESGEGIAEACAGAVAVFSMSPLIERQVESAELVINRIHEAGVKSIVRLSARSAGWDQVALLHRWHREIEELVKASGLQWTILRPCSLFQNYMRYQAEAIRTMSAITIPQGDGLISYVDAKDVGDVAARCLLAGDEHAGQTYTLTGARAYGPKGVAAEIGRVIGRPVMYIDIDPDRAREISAERGAPAWLIEAGLSIFEHARGGAEASVDPTLTQLLGRPATTLSEFVEHNKDAWLK